MAGRNVTGECIRRIRNLKRITQEELVARLNVQGIEMDRTMISKIELGTRDVFDFELRGIAKALGVSIEDLYED